MADDVELGSRRAQLRETRALLFVPERYTSRRIYGAQKEADHLCSAK